MARLKPCPFEKHSLKEDRDKGKRRLPAGMTKSAARGGLGLRFWLVA